MCIGFESCIIARLSHGIQYFIDCWEEEKKVVKLISS